MKNTEAMSKEKTGIAKMPQAMYEYMLKTGPERLITFYILESGYAGVNRQGTIVDRRIYPDATPCPANSSFGTPQPKEL